MNAAREAGEVYARAIRNPSKRGYALAFVAFRFGDAPCPERLSYPGLSVMGAQAVRHQCEDIYRAHFVEVPR